ncbi:hypothetical protein [Nocardia jinanensis]|uniref:Uncharacterized protein n=1 Tax=Nocardia jinanensis TaxID=382504 RepID=A0A917RT63_9NOCA|nr:hypothetical protein [Nocardia jinanensis]GGL25100.1 hypothetical protein GCM10011588_44930 [Nocardia jinanensis]
MLVAKSTSGLYRCPETLHCLHGAAVVSGRVAEHWRNVPGECPWVGMKVTDCVVCPLGHRPWISSRQLRSPLFRNRAGSITTIACPGLCPVRNVTIVDGRVGEHLRDSRTVCAWSGTRIVSRDFPPPLLFRRTETTGPHPGSGDSS